MVCRPGFENDPVERIRHSAAHVLADAVTRLFPTAKVTIGPVVDNGFYYDFDYPAGFSAEDLARIEDEMRRIVGQNLPFTRIEMPRDEAIAFFKQRGENYKVEIISGISAGETISLYQHGAFVDLCKGPHTATTGEIKAIKLTSVAGAYWRGKADNAMLQRVYGTAFLNQKDLDVYLAQLEESKKRDHRKLGKELGIFTYDDDVGPGLPLWLPNGAAIIESLENLAKRTEFLGGYKRVRTPHLAKEKIYQTSGHLPYYADSMFPPMEFDGVKYYLKPMNCPHHHKIFASELRSYRDLPLRLAEYGTCYRYEQSGELFGLMRVRSLQMNDAHIYCTLDQFEKEFLDVCRMYLGYFKIFGVDKYVMRFSRHAKSELGKKYVNEPELWERTEDMVRRALVNGKVPFIEVEDEAAFYGPKIDVQIFSAIGREFTLATNQVDFAVPKRFGLAYKNAENREETPLCIHRAPLGTHERFIGFLIEHYAGAFPFWLAPEQARVITIAEPQGDYAHGIAKQLRAKGFRAEADVRNEKLGLKIRSAQLQKIPYMLVVGKNELSENKVSVRHRHAGDLGVMPIENFVEVLRREDNPLVD